MKRNKGITLIALIITIIVMLILVAVSISVALNTGLFKSASDATKNWKSAQEEEAKGGTIEINGNKYASIEDYMEGNVLKDEVHNWERNGNELKCKHCNANLKIGDVVNYTATGSGSSSISAQMSGADAEQTISADPIISWIVLGIEDSNGNGTNESLLLTTAIPTEGKITFGGAAGYNNGIQEIDRMCKELYGKDARGITVNDVNNCLTYKPQGGTYLYNNELRNVGNFSTSLKELGTVWNVMQATGIKTPDGVNTAKRLGEYILNGYSYGTTDLPSTATEEAIELIFTGSYWLATRSVWVYSSFFVESNKMAGAYFGMGFVSKDGVSMQWPLCYSYTDSTNSLENSIRPIMPIWDEIPELITSESV